MPCSIRTLSISVTRRRLSVKFNLRGNRKAEFAKSARIDSSENALDEIAVVLVDASGSIRYWSKGAEQLFGHSEAVAVGQSLDLIVPAQFREPHWAGFRRAMASGKADAENKSNPLPVIAVGGEIVTASGTLSLLRGLDGRPVGAMVVFG